MTRQLSNQTQQTPTTSPLSSGILQRKCVSCGQHTITGGECEGCQKKRSFLSRQQHQPVELPQPNPLPLSGSHSDGMDFSHIPLQLPRSSSILQPKLILGQPGDLLERQADQVAKQVINQSQPVGIQEAITHRQSSPPLHRFSSTDHGNQGSMGEELAQRLASQTGRGSPLASDVRNFMEPRFRTDFSQVRVHTDTAATEMNRTLKSKAFTHRQDIYFGPGRYNPTSWQGRELLAHELTHVIQQQGKTGYIQRGDGDEDEFESEPTVVVWGHAIDFERQGNGVRVEVVWWYLARQAGLLSTSPPYRPEQWASLVIPNPQLNPTDLVRRLEEWSGLELLPGARSRLLANSSLSLTRTRGGGSYIADLSETQLREWFGSDRWQMFLNGELPRRSGGSGGTERERGEATEGDTRERGRQEQRSGAEQIERATRRVQTPQELDSAFRGALRSDANQPAFPATLEGSALQALNTIGTYRMKLEFSVVGHPLLEIAERLNSVNYHWEMYNITALAQRGLSEQAAVQRRQSAVSEAAEISRTATTRRRAQQAASDLAEDTETSVRGIVHPLDSAGGDPVEAVTNLLANRVNLELVVPSAIIAIGGVALDALADLVGGYSQEREITFPNQEGVYLIRCIATPRDRGRNSEIRRASSVATKIVEVRPIARLVQEVLEAPSNQIARKELNLEIERHRKPPNPEQIQQLEQELAALRQAVTGSAVDAIDYAINQKMAELRTSRGLRQRQIETELEALRQQRALAVQRAGQITGHVYRLQGVLVSELTGQTYPLLLQLGELRHTSSEYVYLLSDVTTRDGKRYEGRGSTQNQAVQNAMHRMALGNEYGRGSITFRFPADAPFQPQEHTERSHPGSERIARQRLNDLASVLITLSLFVPGVGEVAAVLGAGLAADRLVDRWRNGTLRFDAAAVGDIVGILGAAAQGVAAIGRMRVIRAQGRFILALESADEAAIRRTLTELTAAGRTAGVTDILRGVADWGGFAVGNVTTLTELARIQELEMTGAISHAEASRDRAQLLTGALRDGILQFGGGARPRERTAQAGVPHPTARAEGATDPQTDAPTPGTPQPEEGVRVPPPTAEPGHSAVRDFEGPTPGTKGNESAAPTTEGRATAEPTALPNRTEGGETTSSRPATATQTGNLTGNERIRAMAATADGLHHILILDDGRIIRCSEPNCGVIRARYEDFLRQQTGDRRAPADALETQLSDLERQSRETSSQIDGIERQLQNVQARLNTTTDPAERQRLTEQQTQLNTQREQLTAQRQTIADDTARLDLDVRQFAAEGLAHERGVQRDRAYTLLESLTPTELRTLLTPGARVEHPSFGRGTLLIARSDRVEVSFDEAGRRTIMLEPGRLSVARPVTPTERSQPVIPLRSPEQISTRLEDVASHRQQRQLPKYSQRNGETGTVAIAEVGGERFYGTNSTLDPEHYSLPIEERRLILEKLHQGGRIQELQTLQDAQFLSHAEAEALTRAFKQLGQLPEVVELFVDRPTCQSCRNYLLQLAQDYGASEIRIYYRNQSNPPLILH